MTVTTEELFKKADEYFQAESRYDEARKISSGYKEEMDAKYDELLAKMEEAGLEKLHYPNVASISKLSRMKVQTPKTSEDKMQFFGYVTKHYGDDGLWTLATVNHNTLNTFYNQEFEKHGAENPLFAIPGVGSPTEEKYLRVTTSRK